MLILTHPFFEEYTRLINTSIFYYILKKYKNKVIAIKNI